MQHSKYPGPTAKTTAPQWTDESTADGISKQSARPQSDRSVADPYNAQTSRTGARVNLHDDELVSDKEAAAFLGIAVQTLRNWRYQGQGPRYFKIGARLVRYRRADLESFLAESAQ